MNNKKITRSLIKYLLDPSYRFLINARFGKYNAMPDKEYLERTFKCCMKKSRLILIIRRHSMKKLQWLKLNDRKSEYTIMVDKYLVRNYIKRKSWERNI